MEWPDLCARSSDSFASSSVGFIPDHAENESDPVFVQHNRATYRPSPGPCCTGRVLEQQEKGQYGKKCPLSHALLRLLLLSDTYAGCEQEKRIAEDTPYPLPVE